MFRHKNRKGFTLAEALLAVVLLSMAAAGVLLPFTSGAAVRAEGMRRTLAAKLATDLTEQIISIEFDQIIGEYGTYNELQGHIVKDFDTEAEFTDPIYANFSRNAACEDVNVPQESSWAQSKFISTTVRVFYDGRQMAAISRLITK